MSTAYAPAKSTTPPYGQPLSDRDLIDFRGIDPEIVRQANVRRVDSFEGREIVGRTTAKGDFSGIIFPYYWPGEDYPREYRLRRDHPEMEIDSNGKLKPSGKYLSPPDRRNMLYFPPGVDSAWLEDPTLPIIITEGEKKTLALHTLALHELSDSAERPRWLSIGISGVWNWWGTVGAEVDASGTRVLVKGVLPDFKRIPCDRRPVKIVFDTNVRTNEDVAKARRRLAAELRSRKAIVSLVDLPELPGVNGVDDLVARWSKSAVLDLIIAGGSVPETQQWEDPLPLTQSLPPVERFNMELLPQVFRRMVADASERMQVPADLIAIPLVTALSAVVGRRARIQPKAVDSQWQVTPNLWGAIIAPPGFLKTPSQRLGTKPLKIIQDSAREEYKEKEQQYKRELQSFKVRESAWHSNALKNAKSNCPFPDFTEPEPEPPSVTRYIVNDATEAKLQEILAANPGGVLFERDELSGWLAQLDQTGREGERAFMLEAWEGNGSHHVDRIGRGTTFCDSLCVSVIGGIQPSLFRAYVGSMLQDDVKMNRNDGLLQRLQLLVWPDMDPSWNYVDREPNTDAVERVTSIFRHISRLDPSTPIQMRFDADAQSLFVEWLSDLERKELRNTDQHETFVSHISKYRSLIPSLAGVFELVEMATDGEPVSPGETVFITSESLSRAISWGSYLKSHAQRAYSCLITREMQAAHALSDKIKAGKLGRDKFRVRSVYLKGWSGLNSPHVVRAALAILEDAAWVRSVRQESQPWRPAEEFEINPKVFGEDS